MADKVLVGLICLIYPLYGMFLCMPASPRQRRHERVGRAGRGPREIHCNGVFYAVLESGLSVANSIHKVTKNVSPVVVLNPSDKPIVLKKNTQLASVELVTDDQPNEISDQRPAEKINEIMRPDG